MAPPSVEEWKLSGNFHLFHHEGVSTHRKGVSRDKAEILAVLSLFVGLSMTVDGHHKSPPREKTRVECAVGKRPPSYRCLKEKC